MRKHLHIDLERRAVEIAELHGEDIVKAGRYLIAKTLLDEGLARIDPWSPQNPLIFSAGPLSGVGFSNGGRISVESQPGQGTAFTIELPSGRESG